MKTILITGASSGFGRATAELLATKGYKLILIARRGDKLAELKQSLKAEVYTAEVDVTDKAQVQAFYDALPEDFRDIDVLVNNAGLALGMAPAQDGDINDWERMVDTNIKGLLYMTRPALDFMKQRRTGQIINIGSVAGHIPYKGGNVYGATKAFVRQFSNNLRTDLFGMGIKVTTIEPGAAETEFSVVRFNDKQQADDFYKQWRPLQPEDVAGAIVWSIEQPPHVNVENIELMALDQTYAGMVIDKKEG